MIPSSRLSPQDLDAIRAREANIGIDRWFYVYSRECTHPHTVAEGNEHRWTAVCSASFAHDLAAALPPHGQPKEPQG